MFSFGVFSRAGPSAVQIKESSFETSLFCSGYSTRELADVGGKPDHSSKYKVSGPESVFAFWLMV